MFRKTKTAVALSLCCASYVASAEHISFEKNVTASADALVLFHSKGQTPDLFKRFDKKTNGQLAKAIKVAEFKGAYGSFVEVLAPSGINYSRVLIAGIGDTQKFQQEKISELGGDISAKLEKDNIESIVVATDNIASNSSADNAQAAALLAHGFNLRAYRFNTYHKEARNEKSIYFDVRNSKKANKAYEPLANVQTGVFLARDLVNETATNMTPVDFANAAKSVEQYGVTVKVLTPSEIEELGMGALFAVGKGSSQGSRLVIAHYKGSDDAPIALVGKGITFDSGGYNVKTGSSISRMKSDMAGAAAALGTVTALAKSKAQVNVVAVMGMAANMVSENSLAPGDVLRTAEGLTVEVLNTDAEGRLVLSDAMWYAREHYQPQIMVDIATLTGSKVRAVGNEYAAIFSDDEQLIDELTFAGKRVNENLWRLPLAYKDKLKSNIADIQNIGSGGPGASTAASFLQHFAGDVRWAHLDIAGNALTSSADGEVPKGATGYAVRLLTDWIQTQEK